MRVMEDAAALTHLGQALASERTLTADLQSQLQHAISHHHMLDTSSTVHGVHSRLVATGPASPASIVKPVGSFDVWSAPPRAYSYGPRVVTNDPYASTSRMGTRAHPAAHPSRFGYV